MPLMTRQQLWEALRKVWPMGPAKFCAIVRLAPRILIPGTRRAVYDYDAVLAWIREQSFTPGVARPGTSLHRSRARKSA